MRFRILNVDHVSHVPSLAVIAYLCLIQYPRPAKAFEASVTRERVTASDSADVVATAEKFHAALAAGDSMAALALLAQDALILEGGAIETRGDYRAHHLLADIEFARAVRTDRSITRAVVQGDAAWIVATSTTQGTMNGRQINSVGAELMVLRRVGAGWQITTVHWSSRNRRAG